MPRFTYQADDADGAPAEGTLEADSLAAAAAQLESLGLVPRSLLLAVEDPVTPTPPDPVVPDESVDRLLAAREHLAPALAAYAAELPPGKRRARLRGQSRTLDAGDSALRAAVAEAPQEWLPLIAATASDAPHGALAHFLRHRRLVRAGQRRLSFAALYPLFLFGLVLLMAWALAVTVIPTFDEIYRDFGLELPASTLALLSISCFLRRGGVAVLFGLAALLALAWLLWPWWASTRLGDALRRLAGSFGMRSRTAANLARETAVGLEAGLSVEDSLRVAEAPQNLPLRPALAMALGEGVPEATRVRLLRQLNRCYLDHAAKRASLRYAQPGPLAIVAVGVVIAFVVIALFAPLVRLVGGLA